MRGPPAQIGQLLARPAAPRGPPAQIAGYARSGQDQNRRQSATDY
jgi:hypothetical protein